MESDDETARLLTRAELRQHYEFRAEGARYPHALAALLTAMVHANNSWISRADGAQPNPRVVTEQSWASELAGSTDRIRLEWDRFTALGGVLPLAQDLFGGDQGHEGSWRMGLMIAGCRPVAPLSTVFPETTQVLRRIPGIHSATWSVMGAGARLPAHTGPNAGGLRLLVGVSCGAGAMLRIGPHEIPLRDGDLVLFDDTEVHASENRGDAPRAVILCDLIRPLPWPASWLNTLVQHAHHYCIPRFRQAPKRGAVLHRELNPAPDDLVCPRSA